MNKLAYFKYPRTKFEIQKIIIKIDSMWFGARHEDERTRAGIIREAQILFKLAKDNGDIDLFNSISSWSLKRRIKLR